MNDWSRITRTGVGEIDKICFVISIMRSKDIERFIWLHTINMTKTTKMRMFERGKIKFDSNVMLFSLFEDLHRLELFENFYLNFELEWVKRIWLNLLWFSSQSKIIISQERISISSKHTRQRFCPRFECMIRSIK